MEIMTFLFSSQMTSTPTKPTTSKVTYFRHFPHNFIRPYDGQLQYTEQEYLEKLSTVNCEWLSRPKIAMSECCGAIQDNMAILDNNTVFNDTFMTTVKEVVDPCMASFVALNTKNKDNPPTHQDVYNVLNGCFQGQEFDDVIASSYQQISAMYVMLSQLRALRGLVRCPKEYARKLVSDAPSVLTFKTDNNVTALQKMLEDQCVSTHPGPTPADRSNLSGQLVNPAGNAAAPTSTTAASGLIQPNQSNPPDNALMDIILGLQQQIQSLQQKPTDKTAEETEKKKKKKNKGNATESSNEPSTSNEPAKKKKNKRNETESSNEPSTSNESAELKTTAVPAKQKKEKSKRSTEKPEKESQPKTKKKKLDK